MPSEIDPYAVLLLVAENQPSQVGDVVSKVHPRETEDVAPSKDGEPVV